jgi:hypothetical protein
MAVLWVSLVVAVFLLLKVFDDTAVAVKYSKKS